MKWLVPLALWVAMTGTEFQPDTPDAGDGAYLPKQEQPAKKVDDTAFGWPLSLVFGH